MRYASLFVVALSLAAAASAQFVPGTVVTDGEPFPVVADFNGDGLDDLFQERNVLLNDGSSFAVPHDLGLPVQERVMGVLDVNGDHVPDLLTIETVRGTHGAPGPAVYRLYIADGSGSYGMPIKISTEVRPYFADVDGDGKDDFLLMDAIRSSVDRVRTTGTEVTVLRSRGDGTFDHLTPFRIGDGPQIESGDRVLSGDFDHDGVTDLVIRCENDLVILRGTGGGSFEVRNLYLPWIYGGWTTRLADVDGDGNLDVILSLFRSIRVFYGDGRGNLPRMTTTTIAKLHDATIPSSLPDLGLDGMNQPRDIAVGHFTRADRTEIAAGMGEGDLVILGYERGALREVARTTTEFWLPSLRPGTFSHSNRTGLYVIGTLYWGEMFPKPRLYQATQREIAAEPVVQASPRRRAASGPSHLRTDVHVEVRGECVDSLSATFVFRRDGIFGVAENGATRIEGIFDGGSIYFRLSSPDLLEPVRTLMTESNGVYTYADLGLTSCGWKQMTITANVVR